MDQTILLTAGAFVGVSVALLIKSASLLMKRGWTDAQLTFALAALTGGSLASGAIYCERLRPSLEKEAIQKLSHLDLQSFIIKSAMIPGCSRILDAGFVVSYRVPERTQDRLGRICQRLTTGEWTWYRDTTNLADR